MGHSKNHLLFSALFTSLRAFYNLRTYIWDLLLPTIKFNVNETVLISEGANVHRHECSRTYAGRFTLVRVHWLTRLRSPRIVTVNCRNPGRPLQTFSVGKGVLKVYRLCDPLWCAQTKPFPESGSELCATIPMGLFSFSDTLVVTALLYITWLSFLVFFICFSKGLTV